MLRPPSSFFKSAKLPSILTIGDSTFAGSQKLRQIKVTYTPIDMLHVQYLRVRYVQAVEIAKIK